MLQKIMIGPLAWFLVSLLPVIYGSPRPISEYPTRIVGGVQAGKNELPYQISLQYNGNHVCGGSIYKSNFIITAAHCAVIGSISGFRIYAGEHELYVNEGTEQIRSVSRAIVHPSYSEDNYENDIAILELSSPLTLNQQVAAIRLPDAEYLANGVALVSGWGTTLEGGEAASILRKVTLPIQSDEKCRESYGELIFPTMICAGFDEGGKDSCQGDSGGPLAIRNENEWILVGIVSWGYGCAQPGYPGVYTEVSHYVDFIVNSTNK